MTNFFRRAGSKIARFFGLFGDPAIDPNAIQVYSKLSSGVLQLFAEASDGTVYQLTPTANLLVPTSFFQDFLLVGDALVTTVAGGTVNTLDVGGVTGTEQAIGLLLLEVIAPGDAASVTIGGNQAAAIGAEQVSETTPQAFSVQWRAQFLNGNPPPTAVADYSVELGFDQLQAISPTPPNHGAAFCVGFNRFGNANWWACFDGNTQTADTGVAVDAAMFHVFKIDVDATATIITFSIDGAQVAQFVLGGPFGGNFMPVAGIESISGPADFVVDYTKLDVPSLTRG